MAVDQLPGRVREFVTYLKGVLARLDQGSGWCAVFWQRDPDGMRACLDGREVPPWDVVESLLQDLAAGYGPEVAHAEAERARPLHAAAQAAHDARPGGRDALGDRFDVMLREQRYAAERQAELGRRLAAATTQEEADAVRLDLAWARDDHERAVRRCAELRSRMAELDRRPRGAPYRSDAGGRSAELPDMPQQRNAPTATWADPVGAAPERPGPAEGPGPGHTPQQPAPATPPPPEAKRKRRRGGARFAGAAEEGGAPVVVPPAAVTDPPDVPVAKGRAPRGARFAGVAQVPEARPEAGAGQRAEPSDAVARRETAEVVARLVRLRSEGRTGEAHALLVEVAHWPADRFPLLAAELQHAGLGADWATLLWEAASLPADRLVAAADALAAAGRSADGEQVLRQGVARPAGEIGEAVLALVAEDRHREVAALLNAYVRVRTPEEAARSAGPGPATLVPLLLAAARGVSEERHWDLVHALRVAGFPA
ncbi:hypothetical protein [Streptomyces sp. NPDC093990]|uniref:hypothetical protein n=1 Tax=Streptomyces sp. NPDC093990 TaxID=3155306 RepID=UPI00342AABC3